MPLIKKDKHENDLDFAKPYPLTKGFFSLFLLFERSIRQIEQIKKMQKHSFNITV